MDSTTGNLESGPGPEGSAFAPGALIDRYRILRPLGQGGMGEVYLALDPTLGQQVALKRVAHDLGFDPAHRERILQEARRASKVSDPRLAGVLNVVEHRGEVVLVMEFVDGAPIRDRLGAPMPLETFWSLAEDCVKAIESAHRQGLVHRDLKPENIMITTGGQVKILDFGIARRLARADDTTTLMTVGGEGRISGTPSYMSPEAYRDAVLDDRTDIFSLGVVFYEMLAGHRPFLGETAAIVAGKILHEEPPPLQEANPAVPPGLAAVVGRMLAKDRDRRYRNAREVLDALMAARRGETVVPLEIFPDTVDLKRRTSGRGRFLVPGAAVILVAAVALVGPGRITDRLGWTPLPARPNVAVLPISAPLEVMGASARATDAEAYGLGLTRVLTAGLGRRTVSVPLQVAGFGDVIDHQVGQSATAREWLGANLALSTRLTYRDMKIHADSRLIDTRTGRAIRRLGQEIPGEERESLFGNLLRGYATMLGLPPDSAFTPSDMVGGPGTERYYLQGLGKAARATVLPEADRAPVLRTGLEDLERACSMDAGFPGALAALAETHLALFEVTEDVTDLTRAQEAAETAVRRGPGTAFAHRARGRVLKELDRPRLAQEAFARAAELDPTDDTSLYEAARGYGRRGDKETEIEAFLAAVEQRPHYWRPYWWLGAAYNRQTRLPEAEASFRKLIELAPEFYLGYSNLGAIQMREGDYTGAIEMLRRSNRLHPTGASYSNLGTAYFGDRRFDEAIETYNKSLRFEETDYALWMNLGDAYRWGGDAPGARQAYLRAIEAAREEFARRPYDDTLAADLALLYASVEEPDSARTFMVRARDRDDASVNYSLALTFWNLAEPDSAFACLGRALEEGFPRVPIEKWVVFDDWREDPRYARLIEDRPETGGS